MFRQQIKEKQVISFEKIPTSVSDQVLNTGKAFYIDIVMISHNDTQLYVLFGITFVLFIIARYSAERNMNLYLSLVHTNNDSEKVFFRS